MAGQSILVGDCRSHALLHSSLRSQTRSLLLFIFPSPYVEARMYNECITSDLSGRGNIGVVLNTNGHTHKHTHINAAISPAPKGLCSPFNTAVTPRVVCSG